MKVIENRKELDKIEAGGLIAAARFARKFAKSKEKLNADIVYKLHKIIFRKSQPVIAGKLRNCEFKKLYNHTPPPHQKVPELMYLFGKNLEERIKQLNKVLKSTQEQNEIIGIKKITECAAWASHQISYIHPFADGNGRTARLVLNLILERYNLPLIIISDKMREQYLRSLAQIDKNNDFEPLIRIIFQGINNYLDKYEKQKINYLKTRKPKNP